MLATRSQISKKKLMTYLIIITLMIGLNVFIYFMNSSNDSVSSIYNSGQVEDLVAEMTPSGKAGASNSSSFKNEKLILESVLFSKLKKIGDWPIIPKNVGKADPFAPYFAQ
jgi:ABC-type cobalt transport system substrate-binding protein